MYCSLLFPTNTESSSAYKTDLGAYRSSLAKLSFPAFVSRQKYSCATYLDDSGLVAHSKDFQNYRSLLIQYAKSGFHFYKV